MRSVSPGASIHINRMKLVCIALTLASMAFFSRLFGAADHEQRKVRIQQRAEAPSVEAQERRARSIAFLQKKGVRTIAHLPVIEDSKSAAIRSTREIAERLIACTVCAVAGETGDAAFARQLLNDFKAEKLLSPKEREFLEQKLGDKVERVQFSWRYERSWVLLWALGYADQLDYPPAICDVPKLAGFLRGKSVEQLVREAKPKRAWEILDEADLIYRLDWAVVDERVNGTPSVPKEVEKGVVLERHAALNWLIGYMGQAWDDISTDT